MNVDELLLSHLQRACDINNGHQAAPVICENARQNLDIILQHSESAKAVMTVTITSIVYKMLHHEQDIRKHQTGIEGGYSGRTFDTNHITPFLRDNGFPAMASSGWLTRSLEQKVPYDMNYTGAIKPTTLKSAFLHTIADIEEENLSPESALTHLLQGLLLQRDKKAIQLAKPNRLNIIGIANLLSKHFYSKYSSNGASRLPVLAIYAIYQAIMPETNRYNGKKLLDLENHTSADSQSGRLGDIDVADEYGNCFEAVEVKFDIPVSHNIVSVAKNKIYASSLKRYYILSTKPIVEHDRDIILADIKQIENVNGCQLIINGVIPTLKYYLRLLKDTAIFIDNYVSLLEKDDSIKFEHKERWNQLVCNL